MVTGSAVQSGAWKSPDGRVAFIFANVSDEEVAFQWHLDTSRYGFGKRTVTVDTALMLAKVFENTPDFWLNLQRRNDIWAALHTPKRKARIEKARPIREAFA